jgi:hypothetical protein
VAETSLPLHREVAHRIWAADLTDSVSLNGRSTSKVNETVYARNIDSPST